MMPETRRSEEQYPAGARSIQLAIPLLAVQYDGDPETIRGFTSIVTDKDEPPWVSSDSLHACPGTPDRSPCWYSKEPWMYTLQNGDWIIFDSFVRDTRRWKWRTLAILTQEQFAYWFRCGEQKGKQE